MRFIDRVEGEGRVRGDKPLFVYAILDAAREGRILPLLEGVPEQHQSLYEGRQGDELRLVAPYLVELWPDSPLYDTLADEAFGKSWGIWLTSEKPFAEVRRHLRRFLMVKLEDGREVYFRFYDPRVLRVFLPACTPEEASQLFGPIRSFWVEESEPGALSRLWLGDDGAVMREQRLLHEWASR